MKGTKKDLFPRPVEQGWFQVMGSEVEANDSQIAEALKTLPEKKEVSDAEIANLMSLVRSTNYHHRKSSLKALRKAMGDMNRETWS